MTGTEAKRILTKSANELVSIQRDINYLMNEISCGFQGIGAEQVANAGKRAAVSCGTIASTLRGINTASLDKKKSGGGR